MKGSTREEEGEALLHLLPPHYHVFFPKRCVPIFGEGFFNFILLLLVLISMDAEFMFLLLLLLYLLEKYLGLLCSPTQEMNKCSVIGN